MTGRFVLILDFFTRLFLPKNIYTEDLKKKNIWSLLVIVASKLRRNLKKPT